MPTWTDRDEIRLQRALDTAAFWRDALDKSVNATSLREGDKARTEYRQLIVMSERTARELLARKRAAQVAA